MSVIAPSGDITNTGQNVASVTKDETYWGYIIRSPSKNRILAVLKQWAAAVFGVVLLIGAIGLWVVPGSILTQDIFSFKLGLSSLLAVFGLLLLWLASQSTKYEFQVNLERRELREVFRQSNGIVYVINQIQFDEVEAVYIDPSSAKGAKSRLVLRLETDSPLIEVACDFEEHLIRHRDRLGRDILGEKGAMLAKSNRGSILDGAKGVVDPELAA